MPSNVILSKNIRYLSIFLLLLITAAMYLPGISGGFYYDDIRPLSALTNVVDLDSALWYVFSETSGPLGRSISMLTFLFNHNDWPSVSTTGTPENFFIFNITLHIFNGLLVFLMSLFISHVYRGKHRNNFWIAFTASAFWLVLPIHVSTSLIAIQRMAGLSAFFVLSGLTFYVYGLHKQKSYVQANNNSPITKQGLYFQLIGVFVFTLLAMFSKENGILLPVFILVLEVTLFASVPEISHRRKLRTTGGILALSIILAYLLYYTINSNNILLGRDFTLTERLMTQPQVLFEYLQLAFFPDVDAFNPFHDNYKPVRDLTNSFKAPVSVILITISLIAAVVYRKKLSVFSFATLWFLSAHLLESTVLNLELYFEHRNYVALFGPCLALALVLQKTPLQYAKAVMTISAIYWVLLVFNLSLTTKLWGNQPEAAHAWFLKQKGSSRASEHLSIKFFNKGELAHANKVIELQVLACPTCLLSKTQYLLFSCVNDLKSQTINGYQEILNLISESKRASGVPSVLAQLQLAISNKDCTFLNEKQIKKLNTAFLDLPTSPFNNKIGYLENLYVIAIKEKNRQEAIRLLYLAWNEKPGNYNLAKELVLMLIAVNRIEEAKAFIDKKLCVSSSWNPIFINRNKKFCDEFKSKLARYK